MKTLLPIILITLLVSANIVKSQSYWQFDYACNILQEEISLKLVDDKYLIQDKKLHVRDYGEVVGDSIITIDTILSYIDTFEIERDSISIRYFHIQNNKKIECATLPLVVGGKSSIPYYPDDERLFFLPKGEIELLGKSPQKETLFYKGESDYSDFEITLNKYFSIPRDFEFKYRSGRALWRFISIYQRSKKMYFLNGFYPVKEE